MRLCEKQMIITGFSNYVFVKYSLWNRCGFFASHRRKFPMQGNMFSEY